MTEKIEFATLHQTYASFFVDVKKKKPSWDYVFFMSIDAEWYGKGSRNEVLTYQMATASETKTNNIIEYMGPGQRMTLAEIVELGLKSVISEEELARLRGRRVLIVLISHNTVAEWSVLADRDKPYITANLTAVRGSPVTMRKSIPITINGDTPVQVKLFDTMLLAPVSHKGLDKLSSLLGSNNLKKVEIDQYYKENMNMYLEECPDQFREYALQDSEITLRLFFLLQSALNELVKGKFELYVTIASAAMESFIAQNKEFKKYKKAFPYNQRTVRIDVDSTKNKKLVNANLPKEFSTIKRSYYGGRNEGYFVGRTDNYPDTKNKMWIDIDFIGCYPTAMALSPKIDLVKDPDYIPVTYLIDDAVEAELLRDNVPVEIVSRLRAALGRSREDFEEEMMKITSTKLSWRIRDIAVVSDNRIIDSWYQRWVDAKRRNDTSMEKVVIPGFARVKFDFTDSCTQFPCLPIKHEKWGLIYPIKGETTVPAAEIMLALEAGAKIQALTSVEFPVLKENEEPVLFLMKHLSHLANERNDHKPDGPKESEIMERLLKEFTNSLYGKFCQGINPYKTTDKATLEKKFLPPSRITEPFTAALTTSLARAALSAVLFGVENFNKHREISEQITIISATTDGLLIGVPVEEDFTVVTKYYHKNMELKKNAKNRLKINKNVKNQLEEILKDCGCSQLLEEIYKFLPILQMRKSRKEMTGNPEILEIKHLSDSIISVKNRGQIGLVATNDIVLLTRFNLRPPLSDIAEDPEEYKRLMEVGGIEKENVEGKWIIKWLDKIEAGEEEIDTYNFITLNTFDDIAKSSGTLDLTKKEADHKVNADFDWKRKMVVVNENESSRENEEDVSPYTIPHVDLAAMRRYRNAMEGIRRTGKVARPMDVIRRVAVIGKLVNARGGDCEVVTRMFLRGVLKGKIPVQRKISPYNKYAEILNEIWKKKGLDRKYPRNWTVTDFKNAKKANWGSCCIHPNPLLQDLVCDLSEAFTADPVVAEDKIFAEDEFKEMMAQHIEYVITAISNADNMGNAHFRMLHEKGLLPGRQNIVDIFSGQLSEEQIYACFDQDFVPGKHERHHAKSLEKIFYRLGIPNKECKKCADVLAPPLPGTIRVPRNRGKKKCTDNFVLAILDPDFRSKSHKDVEIIKALKKYELTKTRFYELKNGVFDPNPLRDTRENASQIRGMARALQIDPAELLMYLIEK